MDNKKDIENLLSQYANPTIISRRKKGELKDLILSLEDNKKIEYYLRLLSTKLTATDKAIIIESMGKTDVIINEIISGNNRLDLKSLDIKQLIISTNNIGKYLTKDLVKILDFEIAKELINEFLNTENYSIIYELGFDHTIIENSKIIYDNLEAILLREGQIEKIDLLKKLYKNNNDILKTDFSILDEKYLRTLGEERINLISCYPEIYNKVLGLDNIRLKILGKCLDNFQINLETDEWTELCKEILKNIEYKDEESGVDYSELIKRISELTADEFEKLSFDKLSKIFTKINYYEISNIDDIENYENIRKNKINERYKTLEVSDISNKRNLIYLLLFSQTSLEVQDLINKFGECIDDIEDEDLKYYIKGLQELEKINDSEILDEIFYSISPIKNESNVEIQRLLKTEYGKLFNKNLLSVNDTVESKEFGENVYELAKDENGNIKPFNAIVTTLAPFVSNNPENYYQDWNRSSIKSQHFCSCYIRRNMLAMPNIKYLTYGFSSIADDALMLSGRTDIYSSNSAFVSHVDVKQREKYYSPDKLIDSTLDFYDRTYSNNAYNELDFRRIQKGEKKQPDYIVVFKIAGKIHNMEEAKKASKQFEKETGNILPIIIIDKEECLDTERRLVETMIEEYESIDSIEQAKKIVKKMHEMSYSINPKLFEKAKRIMERVKNNKEITITDFKECFENTTSKERENYRSATKLFYQRVLETKGRKENEKDER